MANRFRVEIDGSSAVTAILYRASGDPPAGITLILGHGAGGDQESGFMVSFATEIATRGIDVVTFNFLYTEQGRRAPDRNDGLESCYRAVIESVRSHELVGENKLAIGGKSMGGRIASQVAARGVGDLAGLVFLGYPLHPPGKPDQLRSAHLARITAPMLFVQGTRDAFGTPEELRPIARPLKSEVSIYVVEGGDHSFKVPKKSPKPQPEVYTEVQEEIARWLAAL